MKAKLPKDWSTNILNKQLKCITMQWLVHGRGGILMEGNGGEGKENNLY